MHDHINDLHGKKKVETEIWLVSISTYVLLLVLGTGARIRRLIQPSVNTAAIPVKRHQYFACAS